MPAPIPELIKTVRLVLRPFCHSDLDDVFAYASDEKWSRYLPTPLPYTRQHTADFLEHQSGLDRAERANWAITLADSVIGGINIRFWPADKLAELGFSVARIHWGQGFATEAAQAIVAAAFSTDPDLNRMRAMADDRNLASQKVLTKLGMSKEGVLRQNRSNRGVLFDEVWFGLLRSEWQAAS